MNIEPFGLNVKCARASVVITLISGSFSKEPRLTLPTQVCNWVPAKCFESDVNLAMKQNKEASYKGELDKIKYF